MSISMHVSRRVCADSLPGGEGGGGVERFKGGEISSSTGTSLAPDPRPHFSAQKFRDPSTESQLSSWESAGVTKTLNKAWDKQLLREQHFDIITQQPKKGHIHEVCSHPSPRIKCSSILHPFPPKGPELWDCGRLNSRPMPMGQRVPFDDTLGEQCLMLCIL